MEVSAKTGANIDKLISKILYSLEHVLEGDMHDQELRKKIHVELRSSKTDELFSSQGVPIILQTKEDSGR